MLDKFRRVTRSDLSLAIRKEFFLWGRQLRRATALRMVADSR
jgi:hypothetical protein